MVAFARLLRHHLLYHRWMNICNALLFYFKRNCRFFSHSCRSDAFWNSSHTFTILIFFSKQNYCRIIIYKLFSNRCNLFRYIEVFMWVIKNTIFWHYIFWMGAQTNTNVQHDYCLTCEEQCYKASSLWYYEIRLIKWCNLVIEIHIIRTNKE